ncbi:DUF1499 domain-containing protein [Ruegeria sp. 2205SS24-7]|uniref:DUF1499 domain-containing protein n=1 Tax=Ruegeria discodermiae TaxID=3064389 RepID=UPI0027404976|nr:DUF1499 domain-containing protein [Ruegeria sp. 2205SS24-7]MDP5216068.1 DUF1499 domain-containing protein [Ruegeria sp. 2205SS24-7]
MGRIAMLIWVLLIAVVVVLGYIRLAPSEVTEWHVAPVGDSDADTRGSVLRVLQAGPEALKQFDEVARADPGTRVLAGSLDQGMITYITRSKVFGFPDYTTAQQQGEILRIYARLRFGRSDLGVNRARVEAWIAQMPSGG